MGVTIEASQGGNTSGYVENYTPTFTCPSGTELLVVCVEIYKTAVNAHLQDYTPSVTYNSDSLTTLTEDEYLTTNRGRHSAILYLENPDTGSAYDLFMDVGGSTTCQFHYAAFALSNVQTGDPFGWYGSDHAGKVTDVSITAIPEQSDSLLIGGTVIGGDATVPTLTAAVTMTQVHSFKSGSSYGGSVKISYTDSPSSGSQSWGWTADPSDRMAISAVEVLAGDGAAEGRPFHTFNNKILNYGVYT